MMLAWRTLRWHKGNLLGSLIALAIAASLTSAFVFLLDSVGRQQPTVERYAAATAAVYSQDKGMITPDVVERVSAVPNVVSVAPELNFAADVLDATGTAVVVPGDQHPSAWAHGWASAVLTPFTIQRGTPPHAASEVVLDTRLTREARVEVGDVIRIVVLGVARQYKVVGIASSRHPVRYQSSVFFNDEHAAELAEQGGNVDALGVFVRRGANAAQVAAALKRVTHGLDVAIGSRLALAEGNLVDDGKMAQSMVVLVVLVLLIAIGVTSGAMGVSIRRRSKEIAILRALGARPGSVRRMLLAEGLLLCLVAAALGLPAGRLIAAGITGPRFGFLQFSASYRIVVTPWAIGWTTILMVLIAEVSALIAVREALRIRPGDALIEAPAEGRSLRKPRLLAGATCLAFAASTTALLTSGWITLDATVGLFAPFGVIALVVAGAGLLGPWAVLFLNRLIPGAVGALSRVTGFFAVANVKFNHRRFAGTMGPLALGATLAGSAVGMQQFFNWQAAADVARTVPAEYVIDAGRIGVRFSEDLRLALERVTTVAGTSGLSNMSVISKRGVTTGRAQIFTGNIEDALNFPASDGDVSALDANSIAVNASTATRLGVARGSQVEVRFPDMKSARYEVAAVYGDINGVPPLAMSAEAVRPYAKVPPYQRLYARAGDGVSASDIKQVADRVAIDPTVVEVRTHQEFVAEVARQRAELNQPFMYIVALIAIFCLVATINALAVGMLDRRTEFVSMRLLGVSHRQINRMVVWEAILSIAPIMLLATVLAVWTTTLFVVRSPESLMALADFVPWDWLAALGGAALIAGAVGTMLASRAVLKEAG